MKKIIFIVLLIALLSGLFLYQEELLGNHFEPKIESKLQKIMNMRVTLEDLRINAISGVITASYIGIANQPEFKKDNHIEAKGIRLKLDIGALFDKKIHIRDLHLHEPYYSIDRIQLGDIKTNNAITWYRYMKSNRKKKPVSDTGDGKKWSLLIEDIHLHNGEFFMHDHSQQPNLKLRVDQIEGKLLNLAWPNDPDKMEQDVEVEARFGVDYPAPIKAGGVANFSTGLVSFDVVGEIEDGDLMEYAYFFEDMPIELEGGRFSLNTKFTCIKKQVESSSEIQLRNLDLKTRRNLKGTIWGGSTLAAIKFMEDQEVLTLNVPVYGALSDPTFEFSKAYRNAFNEALGKSVQNGVKGITGGAQKIARGTQNAVQSAAKGIGQIANVVTGGTKEVIQETVEVVKSEEVAVADKAASVPSETSKEEQPEQTQKPVPSNSKLERVQGTEKKFDQIMMELSDEIHDTGEKEKK